MTKADIIRDNQHLPVEEIARLAEMNPKYVRYFLKKRLKDKDRTTPIINPKPKKEPYFFTHDPYYNF
jgi:hypothetical protein